MILRILFFLFLPIFVISQNMQIGVINLDSVYQTLKEKELLDSFVVIKTDLILRKKNDWVKNYQKERMENLGDLNNYCGIPQHIIDSLTNVLIEKEKELNQINRYYSDTIPLLAEKTEIKLKKYLKEKLTHSSLATNHRIIIDTKELLFFDKKIDLTALFIQELKSRDLKEVVGNFKIMNQILF